MEMASVEGGEGDGRRIKGGRGGKKLNLKHQVRLLST